jgi:hypothetical protein
VHLNHRALRAEEIDQFFSQQWQYRHSILSMHAAAAKVSIPSTTTASSSSALNRTNSQRSLDNHDQAKQSAWVSSLRIKKTPPTAHDGLHNDHVSPRLYRRRSPS